MKKYLLLALCPLCIYAGSPTIQQIELAMEQGNITQVEQMSTEAVKEHPNSAKAHYFLGQAYFNENRMAEAKTEFITAQNLDPKLSFTKKPEMFSDMLSRSSVQISNSNKAASTQVAEQKNKESSGISLNAILLIIGTSLGLVFGLIFLRYVVKDLKNKKLKQNDLGSEFELENESVWKSNPSDKGDTPSKMPATVTKSYMQNSSCGTSLSNSSQILQQTVIKEREIVHESSNDGLLTGIIVGSMLSHHGHDGGTTVINNVNNDYSGGSSTDSSSRINWDSNDNSSSSFDTSPDSSSWDDSSGSSFDFTSTSDNNW